MTIVPANSLSPARSYFPEPFTEYPRARNSSSNWWPFLDNRTLAHTRLTAAPCGHHLQVQVPHCGTPNCAHSPSTWWTSARWHFDSHNQARTAVCCQLLCVRPLLWDLLENTKTICEFCRTTPQLRKVIKPLRIAENIRNPTPRTLGWAKILKSTPSHRQVPARCPTVAIPPPPGAALLPKVRPW